IRPPSPMAPAVVHPAAKRAVGATRGVEFGAAIGEAVLHLEAYRAAKRIEAEGRIVGPDVGATDSDGRNEVPVDGVAEGFVDPHPLHIDRKPLWGALQRRGGEATIAQVWRE